MTTDAAPAAASPAGRSFWLKSRLPILLGVICLLAIAGIGIWLHLRGRETTDDAQVEGHIIPIGTRVGGTVREVLVKDNQQVKAGDVLVLIDPRDYQVALARARAELADARAALDVATSTVPIVQTTSASDVQRAAATTMSAGAAASAAARDVDTARARLDEANARVTEAEATAERARKDRDRLKGLVAKEEISQQQFDAAVAAAAVAEAGVASAKANVHATETAVRVAESKLTESHGEVGQAQASERATKTAPDLVRQARARVEAAEARVAQSDAAVKQAELMLEYTTLKAPTSGVVSRKSVEPGQVVQSGQSLFALVSLEDVWVIANFKETQLADIRVGQPVTIDVDAYDHDADGRVESIAPATGAKFSLLPAENASGNFVKVVQRVPVKIAISPASVASPLRPGMSVYVTVHTR